MHHNRRGPSHIINSPAFALQVHLWVSSTRGLLYLNESQIAQQTTITEKPRGVKKQEILRPVTPSMRPGCGQQVYWHFKVYRGESFLPELTQFLFLSLSFNFTFNFILPGWLEIWNTAIMITIAFLHLSIRVLIFLHLIWVDTLFQWWTLSFQFLVFLTVLQR